MRKTISILLCVLLAFAFSLAAPLPVRAEETDPIPVAQFVADNHVLMTRADGRFLGWGDNTYGQLGLGEESEASYTTPVEITFFRDKGKIKQIAAIKDTSFVLMNSGELYSTGSGTYGKHGQGDTYDRMEWGRVGGELKFKKLYTNSAAEFCLAEDYEGSLYAWGKNSDGQLGVGDTDARTSPTLVKEDANVKSLWLGETYVEYVDLDGHLYFWGNGSKGQMGLSSAYTKTTHRQTRYSTGERENVTSSDSVTVLNPSDALVPTKFNLISENELLDMSTPEPEPPAVGQANYTKLKYNINPRIYGLTSEGDHRDFPNFAETGRTGSSSDGYNHNYANVPEILVSKRLYSVFSCYIYVGTGTDAGKTLSYKNYNSSPFTLYYPIVEQAVYTCPEWYTGKTVTVGPSTSPTNYLFRDAYTGQLVVDQTQAQTIYLFKISLPTQYNQMPATQYSIGVTKNTYDLIMANQGASLEQEWCDYRWNNRTLLDTAKDNINVLAGANHALAMVGGKLYGWGDVSKKQLADIAQSTFPTELTAANTLVTQQKAAGINLTGVKTDRNSNYLTFDDGSVWTWGDNSFNKSGVDGAPVNIAAPTKVTALQDKKIINIVPGRDTNYYITENGEIYVSGSNVNGVSGLGEEYKDEATIDTPTKLGSIGFSETLEPPAAPLEITVPEKAEANSTIQVLWNSVDGAAGYELKRTVTLKGEGEDEEEDALQAEDMDKIKDVQVTSMVYVPKVNDIDKILMRLAASNNTPQTVYHGNETTFTDTANEDWKSVTYELKAVNAIGDYSSPVISSTVPIVLQSNDDDDNGGGGNGGGDDDGGNGGGNNGGGNVVQPPVNVTVNPPDITIQPPDVRVNTPEIRLPDYPEIEYNSNPQDAAAPNSTINQPWLPTPAQLQALGLGGGNGNANMPYVITIQPSAPQYIQPPNSDTGNDTLMYVIIFVLISVIIAIVAFSFASMIFNKNSGELHRIRFMLSELFDSNE